VNKHSGKRMTVNHQKTDKTGENNSEPRQTAGLSRETGSGGATGIEENPHHTVNKSKLFYEFTYLPP